MECRQRPEDAANTAGRGAPTPGWAPVGRGPGCSPSPQPRPPCSQGSAPNDQASPELHSEGLAGRARNECFLPLPPDSARRPVLWRLPNPRAQIFTLCSGETEMLSGKHSQSHHVRSQVNIGSFSSPSFGVQQTSVRGSGSRRWARPRVSVDPRESLPQTFQNSWPAASHPASQLWGQKSRDGVSGGQEPAQPWARGPPRLLGTSQGLGLRRTRLLFPESPCLGTAGARGAVQTSPRLLVWSESMRSRWRVCSDETAVVLARDAVRKPPPSAGHFPASRWSPRHASEKAVC